MISSKIQLFRPEIGQAERFVQKSRLQVESSLSLPISICFAVYCQYQPIWAMGNVMVRESCIVCAEILIFCRKKSKVMIKIMNQSKQRLTTSRKFTGITTEIWDMVRNLLGESTTCNDVNRNLWEKQRWRNTTNNADGHQWWQGLDEIMVWFY